MCQPGGLQREPDETLTVQGADGKRELDGLHPFRITLVTIPEKCLSEGPEADNSPADADELKGEPQVFFPVVHQHGNQVKTKPDEQSQDRCR